MITHLTVFDSTGEKELLRVPIYNPEGDSRFLIKDIGGLGAPKASIVTADYALMDGAGFVASRTEMRNITFRMGYRPRLAHGEDVQLLRKECYSVFNPQRKIRLKFESSSIQAVYLDGWVETNEPSIFASEPEVNISIICPAPYFKDAISPTYDLTHLATNTSDYIPVTNTGDVETGLVWTVQFGTTHGTIPDNTKVMFERTTSDGTIMSADILNSKVKSITGAALNNLDKIVFSSVPGEKGFWLYRDINRFNILSAVDNQLSPISWGTLPIGERQLFRYMITNDETFPKTTSTISYTPLYQGI